jgi:hypothetical protein
MTDTRPLSAVLRVFNYKQPEEKDLKYVTSTQICRVVVIHDCMHYNTQFKYISFLITLGGANCGLCAD